LSHKRRQAIVGIFFLRAKYLPADCLVVLLRDSLRYSQFKELLQNNHLYKSLPDPLPTSSSLIKKHFQLEWQKYFDNQMAAFARSDKHVLFRACRPCTYKPDPILYLPMSTTAHSRLVRWRLGRFAAMQREECPCMYLGTLLRRDRFLECHAIVSDLGSSLPVSPLGVDRIDYAVSCLSTNADKGPPPYWPALLSLLWYIDTLCHPSKNIPEDPDTGSSWFSLSS
jgi:hypothetical protein